MPEVNPSCYHLSASSIRAFKSCPTLFRLAYREGLRPAADNDSQRVGTNWHAMHECYANALGPFRAAATAGADPSEQNDYAMQQVVNLLDEQYRNVPVFKTAEEWALERMVLYISFVGYQWYYTNDPVEFLHSEFPIDLPLHMPKTGLPLSMDAVKRVGKIDHIIRWQGMVGVLERKSTSRSIAPDSDYWDKSKKDTQVSMYALAFQDIREAAAAGRMELPFTWGDNERFGNTLYDVWHKPTIKPKMLTQAETRAFIDSGEYHGQKFDVQLVCRQDDDPELCARYSVDGENPQREVGKKGFAIRETVGMFGARLLADIYERPDFYYVRKEIARTDAELRKFRGELFAHYQNMKLVEKYGTWTENELQCRANRTCDFISICYGPGADAVCDGRTTPNGFKRIFVDLTVNGKEVEE